MKKIEYIVEGMRCQSCASAVSHKIESFTEIKEYSVNVFSGEVEIEVEDKFALAYADIELETQREEWRADRRRKRHESSLDALEDAGHEIADTAPTPDEVCEEMDMRRAVRQAIKQLPSHYQELIHRVFFKGETAVSIAKEKGTSRQAIDKQLKNAKIKLKEILKNFSF